MGYERNVYTLEQMNQHGFEIIKARDVLRGTIELSNFNNYVVTFEGAELARGGGGARCMSMPVSRKSVNWQFVGNDKFMEHSYRDARELIRRDRNHASVVMWELSLNESGMPDHFMKRMNEIAREESPESKLITCGWIDRFYDVYIPARQHAKFPDYWKKYTGKMPLFTGEYGDWEYFAQDAGLNQAGYAGLKSDERTSRQLRGDGEKRLLQQATNFQEAHNDNLRQPHLGDANWLMFDYNRGYSPDIESSGVMDIFRLPKWSYYFYRSQQLPTTKIASYWNEKTDASRLTVYSDGDEVALYLNNKMIELKKVERTPVSDQLPHPPFVFDLKTFRPGTLRAVGLKGGIIQSVDQVTTAGKAHQLKLSIDFSGKQLKADGADVVFVYATVCDVNGNAVMDADVPVLVMHSHQTKNPHKWGKDAQSSDVILGVKDIQKYAQKIFDTIEMDKHHPFLTELMDSFDAHLVSQQKAKETLSQAILDRI
jgi:beta-galactosidase